MKLLEEVRGDLCGRTNEKSATVIVWTCVEKKCECSSQEVREDGFRDYAKGQRQSEKYWGKVIRQDVTQLRIIDDMTLDRKE